MRRLLALVFALGLACGGTIAESPGDGAADPPPADDGPTPDPEPDPDRPPRSRHRRGPGAGGGTGPTAASTAEVIDLRFEGRDRKYRLVLPAGYQPEGTDRYPVILAFHGGGEGNTGLNMEVNWADRREGARFLVFPDSETGIWNARGNGGPAEDVDPLRDARFAAAVVDHLSTSYRVDSTRVFAVGFSNGSALVWELLCSAPDRYAGFAMISLGMTDRTAADCRPAAVRPTLYMHGTADSTFDGERLAEQFVPGGVQLVSAATTLEVARAAMGCGEPQTRELPDLAPDDATRVKLSEQRCRQDVVLRYYEIEGGGHVWPGKTPRKDRGGKNRSTRDIDANDEILTFFGLSRP